MNPLARTIDFNAISLETKSDSLEFPAFEVERPLFSAGISNFPAVDPNNNKDNLASSILTKFESKLKENKEELAKLKLFADDKERKILKKRKLSGDFERIFDGFLKKVGGDKRIKQDLDFFSVVKQIDGKFTKKELIENNSHFLDQLPPMILSRPNHLKERHLVRMKLEMEEAKLYELKLKCLELLFPDETFLKEKQSFVIRNYVAVMVEEMTLYINFIVTNNEILKTDLLLRSNEILLNDLKKAFRTFVFFNEMYRILQRELNLIETKCIDLNIQNDEIRVNLKVLMRKIKPVKEEIKEKEEQIDVLSKQWKLEQAEIDPLKRVTGIFADQEELKSVEKSIYELKGRIKTLLDLNSSLHESIIQLSSGKEGKEENGKRKKKFFQDGESHDNELDALNSKEEENRDLEDREELFSKELEFLDKEHAQLIQLHQRKTKNMSKVQEFKTLTDLKQEYTVLLCSSKPLPQKQSTSPQYLPYLIIFCMLLFCFMITRRFLL